MPTQVRCKTCRHIQLIITFKGSVTGKTYPIKATVNCKTANVVYVIECTKCNEQYVGETENTLHIRMNGHRSGIKHLRLEKPVASHFNSEGHSLENFSIFVIEQIHREEANLQKTKEAIGSGLLDRWSLRDLTSIHRSQNWNNDGPIGTVFHQ